MIGCERVLMAAVLLLGGALELSAQVHNQALRDDPRYLQGQELWRQGKPGEALALYRAMCDEAPEDGTRYLQVASLLVSYSQFRHALPFAELACQRGEPTAQAFTILAMCHLQSGDAEASERVLRDALTRHPGNPRLNFSLGLVCKRVGRLIEAQAFHEKALEADPDNGLYLFGLGEIWLLRSRYPEAEKLFRKAYEVESRHMDASWRLAQTLAFLDRHEEADSWFRSAVNDAFDSGHPPHAARFHYAVYLFERERFAEAEPLLDVLVLDRPKNRMAWMYRGRVQKALGKVDEAKASMERYQELQLSEDAADDKRKQEAFAERKDGGADQGGDGG